MQTVLNTNEQTKKAVLKFATIYTVSQNAMRVWVLVDRRVRIVVLIVLCFGL